MAAPRSRGPVVAFASLKGGVGKTTMSLCAAELLRSWSPRAVKRKGEGESPPQTWPVVIIDADVAGTELHWVWNERCATKGDEPIYRVSESLIDLLEEQPGRSEVRDRLVEAATSLAAEPSSRGLIIPTFTPGTEMRPESLQWKQVLELTGTFVRQEMRRIVEALRDAGCAVVVDLPAFDVGFAHYAADAIRSLKGQVFLVTDCDVRSVRSTEHWLLNHITTPEEMEVRWHDVVVNRAPDRSWRDDFYGRLNEVAIWGHPSSEGGPTDRLHTPTIRPVVAAGSPTITEATGLRGSPSELFVAISHYIAPRRGQFLDDADRRRLRGEAEEGQ